MNSGDGIRNSRYRGTGRHRSFPVIPERQFQKGHHAQPLTIAAGSGRIDRGQSCNYIRCPWNFPAGAHRVSPIPQGTRRDVLLRSLLGHQFLGTAPTETRRAGGFAGVGCSGRFEEEGIRVSELSGELPRNTRITRMKIRIGEGSNSSGMARVRISSGRRP